MIPGNTAFKNILVLWYQQIRHTSFGTSLPTHCSLSALFTAQVNAPPAVTVTLDEPADTDEPPDEDETPEPE